MGCCELAAVIFVLFVLVQALAQGARVMAELALLAGTLVKWVALGVAGAVTLLAAGVLVFGIAYGVAKGAQSLHRRPRPQSSYREAQRWRRGIQTTVSRLCGRGWLTKKDAKRYSRSVDAAVARIRALEKDITTLQSLPEGEGSAAQLQSVADTLLSRLERTHRALVRLLAQSALEKAPVVQESLGQAADELESLLAALEEVASPATPSAPVEDQQSRADAEAQIVE